MTPFLVGFTSDGVMPSAADALILGNNRDNPAAWSFRIDLSGTATTSGAYLGLGNFAHEVGSGYRMSMYGSGGQPLDLHSIELLGSYDHA